MQKTCRQCQTQFEITDEDLNFYDKISPVFAGKKYLIPPPTLCPDCRQQRRLAQGNQIYLYHRKCDFSGKEIISNYHPASLYKVYDQNIWYSDKWDPLKHGRDFDFSRSFFEQWHELSLAVPKPSLQRGFQYDENSDYTNYAGKNKNCYLIFDSDENRDCYYSYSLNGSESCMECYRCRKNELCYECIDSNKCYNCAFIQDSENCIDSLFLKNCVGCKNCIMSSNLRNKEYFIRNKKVSRENFQEYRYRLQSNIELQKAFKEFQQMKLKYPQKYTHGVLNEDVLGDYLTSCKNSFFCFDSANLWDCKYVFQAFNPLKSSMDIQECGDGELLYESAFCGYDAFNLKFSILTLGAASELIYSSHCHHSSNLFGCVGMQRKKYCIFNKQYTEKDYEKLAGQIVEHMMKTGEWGEFFPMKFATFAYNTSLAQQYYPLSKEEVEKSELNWHEEDKMNHYEGPMIKIPDNIQDIDVEIIKKILTCEACGKNYKIIPQELKLYRQLKLPIARKCFNCRHQARYVQRNPRKLWQRTCAKCQSPIQTSYAPERPEIVYCEKCYLNEVY